MSSDTLPSGTYIICSVAYPSQGIQERSGVGESPSNPFGQVHLPECPHTAYGLKLVGNSAQKVSLTIFQV